MPPKPDSIVVGSFRGLRRTIDDRRCAGSSPSRCRPRHRRRRGTHSFRAGSRRRARARSARRGRRRWAAAGRAARAGRADADRPLLAARPRAPVGDVDLEPLRFGRVLGGGEGRPRRRLVDPHRALGLGERRGPALPAASRPKAETRWTPSPPTVSAAPSPPATGWAVHRRARSPCRADSGQPPPSPERGPRRSAVIVTE